MSLSLEGSVFLQFRYRWEQKGTGGSLVDENVARYFRPLEASAAEGVWHVAEASLAAGQDQLVELDLLPREVFGRLIYLGFRQVKLLWIYNRPESQGKLRLGPAAEGGWLGPWPSNGSILLPPASALVVAAPASGWPVTQQEAAVVLAAVDGPVVYEMALCGTLIDGPASPPPGEESSGSEEASGSSGDSSAASSGESSAGDSSDGESSSASSESSSEESGWS